jgi:hypothetical protein
MENNVGLLLITVGLFRITVESGARRSPLDLVQGLLLRISPVFFNVSRKKKMVFGHLLLFPAIIRA